MEGRPGFHSDLATSASFSRKKDSLPVTMTKTDLVLSATMVALNCVLEFDAAIPAPDSEPPWTKA